MFYIDKYGVVLIGAALAFVSAWYWRRKTRIEDELAKALKEREEMKERIDVLEQKFVLQEAEQKQTLPIWAALQAKIIKDMTHPHEQFKEMDVLLEKLQADDVTHSERVRIVELTEERIVSTDPLVSHDEKESAKLLEVVMGKVIEEAKIGGPITSVQSIGEKGEAAESNENVPKAA